MSIIASPLQRAVSSITSLASGIKNLFSGGNKNAAPVILSQPQSTNPFATTPLGSQYGLVSPTLQGVLNAPKTISSWVPQVYLGSAPGTSGKDYISPFGTTSTPIYQTPVSLLDGQNRQNTSSMQLLGGTSLPTGGSITSTSVVSGAPLVPPSAPTIPNIGPINSRDLVGGQFGLTLNPQTNQLEFPRELVDENRNKLYEDLFKMIPEPKSVFEDVEVRRAQEAVNRQKQEVANYTAQLNSVVAQQQADLLNLREVGAREGVTEFVYGGQQATLNREAAIKALPIQAQLSAAQGNLALAQDYLTQLTTLTREKLNNEYQYRKDVYSAVRDYVTGEDKRILNQKEKELDRAQKIADKNLDALNSAIIKAAGQPEAIKQLSNLYNSIGDPKFTTMLAETLSATGVAKTSINLSSDKQRILLGGGFTSTEINQIEQDVNEYGIDQALAGITGESKKRAVREAYESDISSGSKLTRQSMSYLFGIPDDNAVSGFFNTLPWIGKQQTNAQKLDALMSAIEKYQAVGYTDKEILKMMQE